VNTSRWTQTFLRTHPDGQPNFDAFNSQNDVFNSKVTKSKLKVQSSADHWFRVQRSPCIKFQTSKPLVREKHLKIQKNAKMKFENIGFGGPSGCVRRNVVVQREVFTQRCIFGPVRQGCVRRNVGVQREVFRQKCRPSVCAPKNRVI